MPKSFRDRYPTFRQVPVPHEPEPEPEPIPPAVAEVCKRLKRVCLNAYARPSLKDEPGEFTVFGNDRVFCHIDLTEGVAWLPFSGSLFHKTSFPLPNGLELVKH